jgi:hypothetical protein
VLYQASLYQASFILPHCLWLSLLPTTPNKHFVAKKEGQSRELGIIPSFLHSASLPLAQPFTDHTEQALCSAKKAQSRELGIILPHCLWLSLLPTTPNKRFVAQKEGQSRELGIRRSRG